MDELVGFMQSKFKTKNMQLVCLGLGGSWAMINCSLRSRKTFVYGGELLQGTDERLESRIQGRGAPWNARCGKQKTLSLKLVGSAVTGPRIGECLLVIVTKW